MTKNGSRPATLVDYVCALRIIRTMFPQTEGPQDIGQEEVEHFKDEYRNRGFKKGIGPDAPVYKRSATTFNTYLRAARAIWGKWFIRELKIAADNPWETVSYVEVDRKSPEAPDEDLLMEFFRFVKAECPNWDLPIVFLQIKCLLGCRLMDLCSVPSSQLKNGMIELLTKTRTYRRAELPSGLYRAADKLRGDVYLWERYPEQYRECSLAQGNTRAAARVVAKFSPSAFAGFILRLFMKFQKATGKKLTSHMLRKRALTLLFANKVPLETAARMLGMDPQTARGYYLDMNKIDSGKMFSDYADKLIPEV